MLTEDGGYQTSRLSAIHFPGSELSVGGIEKYEDCEDRGKAH